MPLNCWEFKKCGRQPGGEHAEDLGVCRAAVEARCDGVNHGTNGGRVCWLVSGTLCGGEVQGSFGRKLASCANCDFYKKVHAEEGPDCEHESEVLMALADPAQIVHAHEELRRLYAKLKETQAQLVQTRKLEAIGQLAAGIAHEINTPAQFIGDNLRFLKEGFGNILEALRASGQLLHAAKATAELMPEVDASGSEDLAFLVEDIPQAIDQSLEGVERVVSIVRAIKEFSHPSTKEKVPTDIQRAIQNAIVIARGEWKDVAEVHTSFDPSADLVPCIPAEFSHVILDLLVNAPRQSVALEIKQVARESSRSGLAGPVHASKSASAIQVRESLRQFGTVFLSRSLPLRRSAKGQDRVCILPMHRWCRSTAEP